MPAKTLIFKLNSIWRIFATKSELPNNISSFQDFFLFKFLQLIQYSRQLSYNSVSILDSVLQDQILKVCFYTYNNFINIFIGSFYDRGYSWKGEVTITRVYSMISQYWLRLNKKSCYLKVKGSNEGSEKCIIPYNGMLLWKWSFRMFTYYLLRH